jgi:hypothetical protein
MKPDDTPIDLKPDDKADAAGATRFLSERKQMTYALSGLFIINLLLLLPVIVQVRAFDRLLNEARAAHEDRTLAVKPGTGIALFRYLSSGIRINAGESSEGPYVHWIASDSPPVLLSDVLLPCLAVIVNLSLILVSLLLRNRLRILSLLSIILSSVFTLVLVFATALSGLR